MTFFRPSLRVVAVLLGACLLALPACMKAKGEAVLAQDGSGTITEKATFEQAAIAQLIEMAALQSGGQDAGGGGGQQDAMTKGIEGMMNLDAIKKRYAGKAGVTLQSISRTDDLEQGTVAIETKAKFTTIDAYFRVGAGMLGRAAEIRLAETSPGVWTFSRGVWFSYAGVVINDELPEDMAAQIEGMKPMLEGIVGGLEIVLSLQVPGTIVETNGTKNAAGTGVSWTFGFADLTNVKKMKQSVTFKADGLALKPFHIRIGPDGRVEDVDAAASAAPPKAPVTPNAPKEPVAPKEPAPPKEPAAPAVPK